jgi:hypothetical protein
VQIQRRDDELARVQGAMSTLRHAHESRITHKEEPAEQDKSAGAAVVETTNVVVAAGGSGAVASAFAGAAGSDGSVVGTASSGASWQVVSDGLGPVLVALNTARMEASKERQSFADKKAFKDPELFAKTASGKLLGVRSAGAADTPIVVVCAVVKTAAAYEMKYVAQTADADSGAVLDELVRAAETFAVEQGCDQLITLHNGAMSDAEKKWGAHGFKLNGVGPAPEFMVKLSKSLSK